MRVLEGESARRAVAKLAGRGVAANPKVERTVRRIIDDVRKKGDRAVSAYARKLDGLQRNQLLRVEKTEFEGALRSVSKDFVAAIRTAGANIRQFAEWQKPQSFLRTIHPGLRVGQIAQPLGSVGCYVPGGRYPLPSTLLMTVIPAQVAGVQRIQVASPNPAPETLAAAALFGVTDFYRIGGAQAIAAFAYGTETISSVNKIVGPGNIYVTAAKRAVSNDCAIEMLAGPTEAVVIADEGDPRYFAADLVAQAEHDPEALVIFISTSARFARSVASVCKRISRANLIARESISRNAVALVAPDREQAFGWANAIAPEHITVPRGTAQFAFNAGSIFVGEYSPQSLGDYAAGPNHTLPTGGAARFRGGLSVLDFLKIITVQEVSKPALKTIATTVTLLAEAEGLKAHAESVRVRLS